MLTLAPAARAEPVPIQPDRPGIGTPPTVVEPHQVELETGLVVARDGGETIYDAPSTLLRVGFLPRSELRLEWDGYEWQGAAHGALDPALGAKVRLWNEGGAVPQAGVLGSLSVPVGSVGFSSERFDPSFAFLFAHTLSDRLGLGYNVGVAWQTEVEPSGRKRTQRALTYAVGLAVGVSDVLSVFAEPFGDVGLDGQPSELSVDAGGALLVHPLVQLDASVGAGITTASQDFFAAAGISVRLPD